MGKMSIPKTVSKALLFLAFSGFVGGALTVFAQPLPNYLRGDRLSEKKEQVNIRQEEVKEKIATRNAQQREKVVTRLKQVFAKILDRFDAALRRLDRIFEKIQRRIAKLKERGVDTSAAETQLASCTQKKALVQGTIEDSRAKIAAIDANSATVRETIKTAVEALHSAKAAIRDYHKCLVDVTKMLKVAGGREGTTSAQ